MGVMIEAWQPAEVLWTHTALAPLATVCAKMSKQKEERLCVCVCVCVCVLCVCVVYACCVLCVLCACCVCVCSIHIRMYCTQTQCTARQVTLYSILTVTVKEVMKPTTPPVCTCVTYREVAAA